MKRVVAVLSVITISACNTETVDCLDNPNADVCEESCTLHPEQAFCRCIAEPTSDACDEICPSAPNSVVCRSWEADSGPADAPPDTSEPADAGPDRADTNPCPRCEGDTPICDEDAGQCVGCLTSGDCDSSVCNTETNTCVDCLSDDECDGETPRCETGNHQCVQCLATTECTNPEQARCEAFTCSACQDQTDCEGTGQNACDSGTCVECTEATAADHCGDFSCNPTTNECTTTERQTVPTCGPCVSDTECAATHRCVPVGDDGTYCMEIAGSCSSPFISGFTVESVSGEPEAQYCGFAADTTCGAIRALLDGATCPGGMDTECATSGAVCGMVGLASNQCTIPCGTAVDCPAGGAAGTCGSDSCGS